MCDCHGLSSLFPGSIGKRRYRRRQAVRAWKENTPTCVYHHDELDQRCLKKSLSFHGYRDNKQSWRSERGPFRVLENGNAILAGYNKGLARASIDVILDSQESVVAIDKHCVAVKLIWETGSLPQVAGEDVAVPSSAAASVDNGSSERPSIVTTRLQSDAKKIA